MSTDKIPRIFPEINDPTHQYNILYDVARRHTNEEIFIGLTALQEPFTIVRCLDDVFIAVRFSIRSVAKQYGFTEECLVQSLLRCQMKNGVHARNREQVEADRFGRRAKEGPWSGERQRGRARRMLEQWKHDAKKSIAKRPASSDTASVRERMSLKNILN